MIESYSWSLADIAKNRLPFVIYRFDEPMISIDEFNGVNLTRMQERTQQPQIGIGGRSHGNY